MLYRKGIVTLILYFIMELAILSVTDEPYHTDRFTFEKQYQTYLKQVQGKCTDEKEAYLEKEAEKIAETEDFMAALQEKYYCGEISEREYKKSRKEASGVLKNKDGFEALYQQYLYVCEGKENHYFLNDNGWSGLLSDSRADFLSILVLTLWITPVFCREYETGMDTLIFISRQGRSARNRKIAISILLSLSAGLGTSLMEFLFYLNKYGLPNGGYPIQSIEYFGNSAANFSLWQIWSMGMGMKLLGCVYFSLEVLFLSSVLKKPALTALTAIATAVIPYIFLPDTIFSRLPIPVNFLKGADFWKGSQYQTDLLTGKERLIYRELSGKEIVFLILMAVCICILFTVVIAVRNKNQFDVIRHKRSFGEKLVSGKSWFPFLVIFTIVLSGCSLKETTGMEEKISYNSKTSDEYWDGSLYVFVSEDNSPVMSDDYGTEQKLASDPLLEMGENAGRSTEISEIFGNRDSIYYLEMETEFPLDKVGINNSTRETARIVRVDKETHQESIIFEKDVSAGKNILGIEYAVNNKWNFLKECQSFFLNESFLFFISNDGKIRRVNRKTMDITLLRMQLKENIAFDGENIYFLDDDNMLCSYQSIDGTTKRLKKVIASSFYLYENSIYYTNYLDHEKIYKYNLAEEKAECVVDCRADSVSMEKGKLYYIAKGNGTKYNFYKCRTKEKKE